MEETDKAVEDRLTKMMRENPPKLIQYFLAILAKEMKAINAGEMIVTQQMSIGDKRYRVKCKMNLRPIKGKDFMEAPLYREA